MFTKRIAVKLTYLPRPGIKQLQIKQNHAKPTGNTGIAAFINDVWSTSDSSIFGRVSSGGNVGAILCFLLFMLVRRLSTTSLFLQHINFSHRRPQQFLHLHGSIIISTLTTNEKEK